MKPIALVLGDQLFDGLPHLPPDAEIVMGEDAHLAGRIRHHRQKLVLFFSAMRHFAQHLQAQGRVVHYFHDGEGGPGVFARFSELAEDHPSWAYEPADRYANALLPEKTQRVANPMFLTPPEFWRGYRSGAKRPKMGDFYQRQRRRMNLLMEPSGEPVGGQWSFDEDNRKPWPKGKSASHPPAFSPNEITREVMKLVERSFKDHPGEFDAFDWPVTHPEAHEALADFLENRIDEFGPFEDAISPQERTAFHSLLTPSLNIGLLTPEQVVRETMARHTRRPVPLASLEGFLRQIVGWREFIHLIDAEYPVERNPESVPNAFAFSRRLADVWWTGETGLPPIDIPIQRALRHGWCHHIERLMQLGAPMLMCEVHPYEAYRWFMEMFIDSADWVMAPNALGMSQFADDGLFATKPYLSGSAYIRKMGDYPAGDWCDVWDGLYWRFLERQRDRFAKNPRMAQLLRGIDRLEPARKARIFKAAEAWITQVTRESEAPSAASARARP